MSGFVATPPTAVDSQADRLVNDGWFPALALSAMRNALRLDGTVTDARLREAARYAMSTVNRTLMTFKAGHLAAGVATFDAVAADALDGERHLVMLYRRAVFCLVKADLTERYRDFDSTDAGLRRGVELDPAIDEQRRNAFWAVRDILGLPRSVVELI
ncbi:MAG: head completion/stabilization protein [Lysobacter sp.]